MKPRFVNKPTQALTLVEVLVIVAVLIVLAGLIIAPLNKAKRKSRTLCCNCNLKQVGLSFRLWSGDHGDRFPMRVSISDTNGGGTLEFCTTGEVFRHFQVMANELSTPRILICPEDTREPAEDFGLKFSNTNVSYFVGLDAQETQPEMFLSGDRNITGGVKQPNHIIEITTNQVIGWDKGMHRHFGNIAFADGSVQQADPMRLQKSLESSGAATNRLAMP